MFKENYDYHQLQHLEGTKLVKADLESGMVVQIHVRAQEKYTG